MLHDVERSLISIKHLIQHRSTFLLFSCVNYKVELVWPNTSTLSHSWTPSHLFRLLTLTMLLKSPFSSLRFIQRLSTLNSYFLVATMATVARLGIFSLSTCCQRIIWTKIRDHFSSQIPDLHNSSLHCTTYCICSTTQSNTIQKV